MFLSREIEFDVPTVSWHTAPEAVHRRVGTEAERDAAIRDPSMSDEWFNTEP